MKLVAQEGVLTKKWALDVTANTAGLLRGASKMVVGSKVGGWVEVGDGRIELL